MSKFRIFVLIRIVLSLMFGGGSLYFLFETSFWLLAGWMILFFVLGIAELIRYVERAERDLSNFLLAIQQNDFTNNYPSGVQSKPLHKVFNLITNAFVKLRNEKESNFHFLKTIVEHSGVPLLAYEIESEEIILINRAFKDLTKTPHASRLDSIGRVDAELLREIRRLENGEKILQKVILAKESIYLSVVAREMIMQGNRVKVVAFHNINAELDQKEIESWQKLIRVMTHEIKNSVIPIATLSEVVNDMLKDNDGKEGLDHLTDEDKEDLLISLATIEKRSRGLVKFVTNYGDLAKVPKPERVDTDLVSLIGGILQLEEHWLSNIDVAIEFEHPGNKVMVAIDHVMIEQVLINLIKNAAEALLEYKQKQRKIVIILNQNLSETVVKVIDNGPGISQEGLDEIFTPFFTTKEQGSGIGLSYGKQVMRAHKGNLRGKSVVGEGTVFEMSFVKFK